MSFSSGTEEALTSPIEESASVAAAIDAKLMVATGSGDVQQLKDLVKQQEDSKMMVLLMAKQQVAASAEKPPHPQQGNMHPHLLALASSGSSDELQTLLNGEDGQASSNNGTNGRLPMPTRRASSYGDDAEANKSILEGVTAEGDTALHVVAACGQGDDFFTRCIEAQHLLVQQNHKWWRWHWHGCWCLSLTHAEHHALLTTYGYGDCNNFLESARIIYGKAKHLLFVQNNKGDTPLHCAARAGKSKMVGCLTDLALAEGEGTGVMKELLRKENEHKETALNEAVRVGNKDIVDLLIGKDSELANFPQDGGASPMYVAIELRQDEIVKTLFDKSSEGTLSFSGPNGQNALHAAVLRCGDRDLTELLKWNKTHLCLQNKDLTTQRDENGSTPLHFVAARKKPPSICGQVLEANPDALHQPDHAGFFPIHVAASVGAFRNVNMFVTKCPGSASLRDANGRTFLHVAVEETEAGVIWSACRNLSLSWIMNMVDNDGNTALHLAVKAENIGMICALLGNPQVNLNLPNNRGETPLDIAEYKTPEDGLLFYNQRSEAQLCSTLRTVGALKGVRRKIVRVKAHDESKETEVLKDSTGTLCIGSVLIATVTFGATFAVPEGYIADDHNNGGTQVLARRHAFHAFIKFNTFAFASSMLATIFLMRSGNPVFNLWSRKTNLAMASYFVSISITCLVAAFALAVYVVLVPVAHDTAIVTSIVTWAILLYNELEFLEKWLRLLKPLHTRKGLFCACVVSAYAIMGAMVLRYWPLIFIFGFTALANQSPKIEAPAPAPAPAPLAST